MGVFEQHYRERSWSRYRINPRTEQTPKTTESDLSFCNSDSGRFEQAADRISLLPEDAQPESVNSYFVWDWELLAADALDLDTQGGRLCVLSEDWKGHQAGSLIMEIYVSTGPSFTDLELEYLIAT